MNITPLIIGVLLFSGVVVAMTSYYGEIQGTYNIGNSTSTESFAKFNQSFIEINNSMSSLSEHTVGFTTKGIFNPSAWNDALMAFIDVGGILLKMPRIVMNNVQYAFGSMSFMPSWFISMIGIIITVVFVMAVVAIFTKRDDV